MRGWPVPFISDHEALEYGEDWIGQGWDGASTGFGDSEAWRFFMSGQFNQLRSISADWRVGAGPQVETQVPEGFDSVVEVWEILFYITEVFELAARFITGGPPVESTTVSVSLHRLENRALVVGMPGRRTSFFQPYGATIPEFKQERTFTSDELLAAPSALAVAASREFFLRFGWQAPSEQLVEIQRELTEGRL
ncbi:MAG: hypothetical protein JST59_26435 [Actinobacteria bacterium]|nr:hypothetical protein [Actinomycetota bacterium]